MTIEFSDLGLQEQFLEAIRLLGFEEPTPIQAQCIPHLLQGRDIIGKARTGSGKTAAFGLPLVQNIDLKNKKPQALVLAPTRELAIQVTNALSSFCSGQSIRIQSIYGGTPYGDQIRALKRGISVVVGTPGRIIDLINKEALDLSAVRYVVLDEADEMLRMGFIEDVETILSNTNNDRQMALFSATMPPPIRKIALKFMQDATEIEVEGQKLSTSHIKQQSILVHQKNKVEALCRILETQVEGSALIFTRTKQGCADIADILIERGMIADALHGDMGQEARERVLKKFRSKTLRFVVATDVAARGIDVDHISHVINFDITNDLESYVHRIGRTGRAGREGIAITLITAKEKNRINTFSRKLKVKIEAATPPSLQQIQEQRWNNLKFRILKEEVSENSNIHTWYHELATDLDLDDQKIAKILFKALLDAHNIQTTVQHDRLLDPIKDKKGAKDRKDLSFADRNEQDIVINIGDRDRVQVGDILWAVSTLADVPSKMIGKIKILDRKSFVGLPKKIAQQLIQQKSTISIKGKEVSVFERLGKDKLNRRFGGEAPGSMRRDRRSKKRSKKRRRD